MGYNGAYVQISLLHLATVSQIHDADSLDVTKRKRVSFKDTRRKFSVEEKNSAKLGLPGLVIRT